MLVRIALFAAFTAAALGFQPRIALAAAESAQDSYEETIDQSFPLSAAGSFSLTNKNGSIQVAVWDKPEVHVVAVKRLRLDEGGWWLARLIGLKSTTIKTDAEARALLESLRVEFSGDENGRIVATQYPEARGVSLQVAYTITLPKSAKLAVKTDNGRVNVNGTEGGLDLETTNGSIEARATRGGIRAETVNGRVRFEDVGGTVTAETTNGSVDCAIAPGIPLEPIELTSVNGSVKFRVPADAHFELDARTSNGGVSTSLPIANASTQTRRRLEATIGGTGPRVELRTTNGSVRIDAL